MPKMLYCACRREKGRRKGGGNMAREKKDRAYYLNKSADLVSRRVYGLCREAVRRESPADAKALKDLCGLLKEAVSFSLSLEKSGETQTETIRVIFDGPLQDYAE